MSISNELLTLQNTKTAIRNSINAKGGSVGASDTFASYATAIDNLPSGGDNSTLIDLIERDITSITIPSGTTTIGRSAFQYCTRLTSVTIPNTVTSIGNNAFSSCGKLTSVTIPNTVTSIGTYAFSGVARDAIMDSIEIPGSVNFISDYMFSESTQVKHIILNEGTTSIGQRAFNYTGLQNITIPSTVTSIGKAICQNSSSMQYVLCLPTTPPTLPSFDSQYDYPFGLSSATYPIYVPAESVDTYKTATRWSIFASRIYPITQVATVDGNPVYNYDLGMTSTDSITSENMAKMPAGTSLELAEGITWAGGATAFSNYTNLTLPSTFATFGDQDMLNGLTTVTSKATTPPSAERNQIGGSSLTAIYVPAASVDTYKAAGGWSTYASIIEAIPSPSITITEYEGQEVIDNAVDFGDFPGCVDDDVAVDEFAAASANSTFDSDLKAANIIVVEDDNGNDITSQCTFTSPDFSIWDSTQDPSWDGESPVDYLWQAGDTIASGDSQTPGSVSITATYGALTDTLYMEYSKTDIGCEPDPEPEPDPEEEPEE